MADEKQNEELQIPIEWDYKEFKNSAKFKDIKRNKKGQFVPNNEQLRMLVKYEEIKLSEIDTSEVTDMKGLFSKRKDFSGISEWDTSNVTNMGYMFYGEMEFNEDISRWKTSSVTDMSGMFYGADEFNQPIDKWDTSNVTNMSEMFFLCENFNQNINDWDVSNVKDFSLMFFMAESFNQPLDKWDVSNAVNMSEMFFDTKFNQDLSAWGDKLGNLQDISKMFAYAEAFNFDFLNSWEMPNRNIVDIIVESCGIEYNEKGQFLPDNWQLKILVKFEEIKLYEIDTSKITNMECLFRSDENAREDFEGIEGWDTSKVITFTAMFMEASEFNEDISGWDTSSTKSFDFRIYVF